MRILIFGYLMGSVAIGCGGSSDSTVADGGADAGSVIDARPDAGFVDPAGTDYQYVFSKIFMPTTAGQASSFGLNVDGDAQGTIDNALGQILFTLAGQAGASFALQDSVDAQVNKGDIILLANVKATSLSTSAAVGTWIHLGTNPGTAPCADATDNVCGLHLDGSTTFDIDPAAPADWPLVGQIVGGKLTGGPGNVTVSLSLVQGGAPLVLDLVGARVEVNAISQSDLTQGKLAGALTNASVQNEVLPALQVIIGDTIAEDCTGTSAPCCEAGSNGELLIDLFDQSDPMDCVVTLQELRTNSLISSLLAPDIDLFVGDPANGNFAPRQDGVRDSLSLGFGFNAVRALFTPR